MFVAVVVVTILLVVAVAAVVVVLLLRSICWGVHVLVISATCVFVVATRLS